MTDDPDFDPLWNTHLVDGSDEVGDDRFTVAVSVSPDGEAWPWGLDREQIGYVGDNSPAATNWDPYYDPPEHERLGPLPDELYDRIWNPTERTTEQ